jgi:signal transduction histidine kinase
MTTVGSPRTTAQTPAAPPAHGGTPPPVARKWWWLRSSLVARFTVVCLVLILGVGLLAAQVVAKQLRETALDQEAEAISEIVSSRIRDNLLPADLQAPLTPQRMAEIDRLVQDRVIGSNSVGASLWRGDAVVNFSTDRSSVGKSAENDEHLAIALKDGNLSKEIKPSSQVDFKLTREVVGDVMEIYVPLVYGGKVLGSFEVYLALADVDKRIQAVQRAMFLALGGGLAVLFVALLFVVRGASKQLQRQSDELALFAARQEVNRLQTEFVGIVSHELRTPLTALLGFSELLLTDNVADSDRREWTTLLHNGAQRLRHLVEQLLDVSRIDHARLELRLGQVSVEDATEQAVQSIAALPDGLEIVKQFEPGLPPVLADHEKLVQILTNLVSNAVKYSPDGGQITINARRIGPSVRIEVSDQGLGLPSGELESIFDRFHRVDDERRRTIEGTGLGLYITRQLVEMHGGTISVHSLGKGRGSTFTVLLPVAEEEPNNA